jgi:ParB family chromosome partitioning protein
MAKKPSPSKTTAKTAKPAAGKPRGLGRGLSSLLGDAGVAAGNAGGAASGTGAASALSGLTELPIEWINSGPWQPRRRFETDSLAELAESIRSKGLVQPVLVRPRAGTANRYELIAGERRWRAAQMAQLHNIPAIIRELGDEEAYELALIENIQRADLSAIEEAEGYRQLIDSFGYTQERLSEIIGKSRSHIANLMRLLGLPEEVRDMIVDGRLTMGQARPLVGQEECVALARQIADRGLSARQAESLVAKPRRSKAGGSPKPAKSADLENVEAMLRGKLGLGLDIEWNEKSGTGKMTIRFATLEQMDEVMAKLMSD